MDSAVISASVTLQPLAYTPGRTCARTRRPVLVVVCRMASNTTAMLVSGVPAHVTLIVLWLPPDEITAEELHQAIPDSTLTIIPGARHLTPIERPEEIAIQLIALLGRV